jgi:endonuclease/exonuclease/phosphatase family metal-dependent hydrolase
MPVANHMNCDFARADIVRVLTHNIYGQNAHWPDRRQVLIDGIRELSPDLIALQETILSDDDDQVVDLLGTEFHIVHSREREPNGQGITIASRWPIHEIRELDLHVTPRTLDFACTTLLVEIQAPQPFDS